MAHFFLLLLVFFSLTADEGDDLFFPRLKFSDLSASINTKAVCSSAFEVLGNKSYFSTLNSYEAPQKTRDFISRYGSEFASKVTIDEKKTLKDITSSTFGIPELYSYQVIFIDTSGRGEKEEAFRQYKESVFKFQDFCNSREK